MADKNMTPPPINRNGRGPMFRPREKPKNLKGTLLRLWSLTKGQRKGLGWILLLSALTSASAILSPFVIGQAVTALDAGNPAQIILLLLLALYVATGLSVFYNNFLWLLLGKE